MTAYVIEAMLLRWGESHSAGRTVTFLLPDEDGPHPFKGLPAGPSHGQRVALSIALIADNEEQKPLSKEKSPAQRAGCLCTDPLFAEYLAVTHPHITGEPAAAVRAICGVNSRSEFDKNEVAARRWKMLEDDYQEWLGVNA